MSLNRSLMGRRQFLVAAGMTSTAAVAGNRLAGVLAPVIKTGDATAAEKSGAEGTNGVYSDRYSHLLSPLRIGNVVLKNRMMQTTSFPRLMQGPEHFPTEQIINHYADVAKNGCALVCCFAGEPVRTRESGTGEGAHMAMWDLDDITVHHYLAQMTDAIHFYGSKAIVPARQYLGELSDFTDSGSGQGGGPPGEEDGAAGPAGGLQGGAEGPQGGGTGGPPGGMAGAPPGEAGEGGQGASQGMPAGGPGGPGRGSVDDISVEAIQKWCENAGPQAQIYKSLGFDGVYLRIDQMGGFLSPLTNSRTDKYGGSHENRARAFLELFQTVKKACGQDFLIVGAISAESEDGAYNAQDVGEFAKAWEGALDILVLRGTGANASHPSGYNLKKGKHFTITESKAIKDTGTNMVIAVNGGYQDLDQNNEYIASGKTDMLAMARAWIADPEYGKKAYEGRGEDVVPCIMCAECHSSNEGPWMNYCSVNPKFGIAHKIGRMVETPVIKRKVAVIGGGPAGLKAAITAAERGHDVTLYEKNDFLGGQLKHADYASFQWPIKDLKDYLIRQVKKTGVNVLLNTRATPESIKPKGYDAVVLALGATPVIPDILGAEAANVRVPVFVFGNEKALGKNIVVIGGDQIGAQTGMYMAENGHNVTMLTKDKSLAADASIYINQNLLQACGEMKNLSSITGVTVTAISDGNVTYVDAKGNEKNIQADTVVIYAGRRPRQEDAMKFSDCAKRFFIIGDCSAHGDVTTHFQANIRTSIRSGFAAGSEI